jgi:hypothetical protein
MVLLLVLGPGRHGDDPAAAEDQAVSKRLGCRASRRVVVMRA